MAQRKRQVPCRHRAFDDLGFPALDKPVRRMLHRATAATFEMTTRRFDAVHHRGDNPRRSIGQNLNLLPRQDPFDQSPIRQLAQTCLRHLFNNLRHSLSRVVCRIKTAGLAVPIAGIGAVLRQQVIVGALFHNAALFKHNDAIHVGDCR